MAKRETIKPKGETQPADGEMKAPGTATPPAETETAAGSNPAGNIALWESAEIAADTMAGDLVAALLDEFKAAPRVWQMMSESDQAHVIDRLTRRVAACVNLAVEIIASRNAPRIVATLESVTAKKGLKAVMGLSKSDPSRHELLDSVDQMVMIVLPAAEQFGGGTERNQPEPDQRSLDIGDDDSEDPDHFDND